MLIMKTGIRGMWIRNKRDFLWVLSLILIFTLAIPIVNPHGNFPLIDDWSYAETTRRLVLQHEWRPLGFTGMPLLTQSLWGAVACTILGYSFEHLRFATIFAGLILLLSSYILFCILCTSRFLAFVAATSISLNPITFVLTYTFMTDVLFEMLLVVSSIFFIIALKQKSSIDIGVACVFITSATLCRQLGPCLSVAFCISYLSVSAEPFWRRVAKSAAPLLVSVIALFVYEEWLRRTGRLPALYDMHNQAAPMWSRLISTLRSPIKSIGHIAYYGFVATLYLGFFCLPVTLCIARTRDTQFAIFQKGSRFPLVLASFVSILIVGLLLAIPNVDMMRKRFEEFALSLYPEKARLIELDLQHFLMPLSHPILNRNGIGPLTLRDTFILHLNSIPDFSTGFWALITCASVIGAWLFVYQSACSLIEAWSFISHRMIPASLGVFIFSFVGLLIYLSPLLVAGFQDRYIAAIVPLACIMLVSQASSSDQYALSGTAAGFAICVGLAIFSILTTHDYLSWNRARWQAIENLEQSSVADVRSLDGGFEYNGYRSYNPAYVPRPSKSWWWINDDKYMITFAPLPGMEIVRRYDYATYLPIATRFIYVLRRPGRE
jgi:hypothetical protein